MTKSELSILRRRAGRERWRAGGQWSKPQFDPCLKCANWPLAHRKKCPRCRGKGYL